LWTRRAGTGKTITGILHAVAANSTLRMLAIAQRGKLDRGRAERKTQMVHTAILYTTRC